MEPANPADSGIGIDTVAVHESVGMADGACNVESSFNPYPRFSQETGLEFSTLVLSSYIHAQSVTGM